MNQKVHTDSTPGTGTWVEITNPVKHTTYLGEVLRWTLGDPEVRLYPSGEIRYFPHSWVTEVDR